MRNTVTFLDVCQNTSVFPWKSVRFLISWSIFHKLVGVTSWSQFDLWQPTVSNIPPERKYRRYPCLKIKIRNEKIDITINYYTILFTSLCRKNKQFLDKLLQIWFIISPLTPHKWNVRWRNANTLEQHFNWPWVIWSVI